jgi:hypothetical protein
MIPRENLGQIPYLSKSRHLLAGLASFLQCAFKVEFGTLQTTGMLAL